MTKQHFIALAAEIAAIHDISQRLAAAYAVANVAKRFNPRFQAEKFMQACDL